MIQHLLAGQSGYVQYIHAKKDQLAATWDLVGVSKFLGGTFLPPASSRGGNRGIEILAKQQNPVCSGTGDRSIEGSGHAVRRNQGCEEFGCP